MRSPEFIRRSNAIKASWDKRRADGFTRRWTATQKRFQNLAVRYVDAAKASGFLPELDGSIACIDCGAAAQHYDHRDYSRPLNVEPVCVSCNCKRGPGVMPAPQAFGKFPAKAA